MTAEYKSVLDFIKRVLTNKYIGPSTSKVSNFRLKYNQTHTDLPTFDEILKDQYFTGVTPTKKMNAVLKMIGSTRRPPSVPIKLKPKSPKASVTPNKSAKASAMKRAAAILATRKDTKPVKKRPGLTRTWAKPLSK